MLERCSSVGGGQIPVSLSATGVDFGHDGIRPKQKDLGSSSIAMGANLEGNCYFATVTVKSP
jgi:hypothetical protein